MFKSDYIMEMISHLIRFLSNVLFGKDIVAYEVISEDGYVETDYVYREILKLLEDGKINEAENFLYEYFDPANKEYAKLAIDFYSRLNKIDDKTLEAANFSRKEVEEGLREISSLMGIRSF